MKSLKYMAIAAIAALAASCTLDLPKEQISSELTAPVLRPVSNVLSDANTTKVEQVVFTWDPADFGAKTEILYSVYAELGKEKALVGQNYKNSLSINKGDLVGIVCSSLNGEKNSDVTISAYVEATLKDVVNSPVLSSEKVSFLVHTFLPPKKSIWLPGKYQGWSQFGTEILEVEAGTSTYKILVDVSNAEETPYYFKIVDENQSWVGMNDGYKPEGWEVADPANGDGNFSVTAEEPIMWLTINTKQKTVAREVVSKVAMIGSFQSGDGWDEATEPEFRYDPAKNVWESPVISFKAGDEWLLRLNGSWEHKYGSAVATTDIAGGYEITKGGENIPAPGAGDYIVRLHANRTPIVVTYEKQ